MKSLKIIVVTMILVLGFSIGSLYAEETEVSGSASVDVMSNYVWRGFKLSDDFVIQPSVGITYGGFGANLWANYDTDTNEHTETDLTLNYTFSLDKFSFDAGYIYYALDGVDDTQEIYVSAGYDILLSPTLTIYYDLDEGDGAFIVGSIGHSFEVSEGIELSLGASASYNADSEYSIGDYSDFHNGELSASVSIPITDAISVEPIIAYTFPLSDDAEDAIEAVSFDEDSSIFYGGASFSLSF
jgi:hypothetical protein